MTHTSCAICGLTFEARTSYGLCPLCANATTLREFDRLESAKRRAARARLPVTLTLVEWLSVISDFNGRCAYCLVSSLFAIEPVHSLEGLARENIVPICRSCAVHRRTSFEAAKQRVEAYLKGDVSFRFDHEDEVCASSQDTSELFSAVVMPPEERVMSHEH